LLEFSFADELEVVIVITELVVESELPLGLELVGRMFVGGGLFGGAVVVVEEDGKPLLFTSNKNEPRKTRIRAAARQITMMIGLLLTIISRKWTFWDISLIQI
jgi:hypothetical protein